MFIKYDDCGDNILINVPDTSVWKIIYKYFDEEGNMENNLYLIIGEDSILLRDTDYWCQGRPNLNFLAVGFLLEEIVDVVSSKIASEPNVKIIDIVAIENKLIEEKYKNLWLNKGYIDIDKDGNW